MKSQTTEINVSFAIDFNGPKTSFSVFYYTRRPDVRISTALQNTIQRNSIHHREAHHAITQLWLPPTSIRFLLYFSIIIT